jgi:hypothetical protein
VGRGGGAQEKKEKIFKYLSRGRGMGDIYNLSWPKMVFLIFFYAKRSA